MLKPLHFQFLKAISVLSRIFILFFLSGATESTLWAVPAEKSSPEYQIKAAFLYNFGKFIEWPASGETTSPLFFRICILGDDPFGEAIDEIKQKQIGGREVIIDRIGSIEEIQDFRKYRILFISASETKRLGTILEKIDETPVLTVADHPGAARTGVMINLVTVNDRIGFEINLGAASGIGIKINSKLLKLAVEIVE